MTSRRGTPAYVISDNGTNFVGAEREMRQLVQHLDGDKVSNETTKNCRIDWDFNPPSAPHFGGVYEVMVRSAKKPIRAILEDADVSDEELLGKFRKGWRKEFLPSLNNRKKWFHRKQNLEEDVVLMVEPNASRGEWPLGRVIEVLPGADGLVRVVKVKAKGKVYVRPVHRLCPL